MALIEPTLTAWRNGRLERRPTGQPAKIDLRDVFDALLYLNRAGIPWKYLPHDFPGHGTVYFYYAAWRDEGILAQLNHDLTGLARVKEGRKPEPTASVIDTQSVKTSTNVPLSSQGTDAAKKTSDAENVSSGEGETGVFRGREGYGLVEQDAVSQAVVEAADHSVEEVPLGGRVAISGLTSAVVVSPRPIGMGHRREGPHVADPGQPLVLHPSGRDGHALAGVAGDRGATRVSLQPSGVGEPSPVVADFRQNPSSAERTQP